MKRCKTSETSVDSIAAEINKADNKSTDRNDIVSNSVTAICEDVKKYGQVAVWYYTRKFDHGKQDGTLEDFILKLIVLEKMEEQGLIQSDWKDRENFNHAIEYITEIYNEFQCNNKEK